MAEWKLYEDTYVFQGRCLRIMVCRLGRKGSWHVTCKEARLAQVQLMDQDAQQACNEAIGMVGDRLGWLARGWIKDLKGVTALVLDDLDSARTSS